MRARSPTRTWSSRSYVAQASRTAYRGLVYDDPAFYAFFQAVTPIDVIERMQIGSRSVHRTAHADLSALLPVPWVFAWSQARYMLPGWYGAGSGLAAATPPARRGTSARNL